MIKKALSFLGQLPRNVFLGLFIASAIICVWSLRDNNLTMVKLRNAVYDADKNGGDINAALNKLRVYVYGHMNTNLSSGTNIKPPIQLKYTYERLQSTAQQQATNVDLYTDAQNYCQEKIPASVSFYGAGRISCVQDYILSHGGKAAPKIPSALYEFDFISPVWSPDLAGWSLILTTIFLLAFLLKLIFDKLLAVQIEKKTL